MTATCTCAGEMMAGFHSNSGLNTSYENNDTTQAESEISKKKYQMVNLNSISHVAGKDQS